MEGDKKDEAAEAVVMWQQAPSAPAGSGSPAKKATSHDDDASLEAQLIEEDEQEAISQAAAAAAVAARKVVAAAAAAKAVAAPPRAPVAPAKDEGEADGVTRGVVEVKRGRTWPDEPSIENRGSGAAAPTARATTPTPAVTLPASFSFASPLVGPASRSPSWGPAFGIGAGSSSKSSSDQNRSPPPITVPASAVAVASPPDMVSALTAAVAASRKRPLPGGEKSSASASASPGLLSISLLPSPPRDDEDRATRALLSPWLLLDGSPTFGAKGGPQVPAVAPEDLWAGAEELRKRLRVEVARTREVQEEMRLLLNPPTTTSC